MGRLTWFHYCIKTMTWLHDTKLHHLNTVNTLYGDYMFTFFIINFLSVDGKEMVHIVLE